MDYLKLKLMGLLVGAKKSLTVKKLPFGEVSREVSVILILGGEIA